MSAGFPQRSPKSLQPVRARSRASETAEPDQVVRSFNGDELAVLRHVFTIEDKQGSGLVPATSVGYMLERCRMPIDEVSIERLLLELEADDDTRITFAEFPAAGSTRHCPNRQKSTAVPRSRSRPMIG